MERVRWGIIGPGAIADAFANGLKDSQTGRLCAVASRSAERSAAFAERFGSVRAYGSYEALLEDAEVEAVYIATPHPMHLEWGVKSARAGKHVLVEKPIGLDAAQAGAAVEAARQAKVFMMEAFMYRCHPQTVKVCDLIRSGAIGDVRVISASFSFCTGYNPESRIWAKALAGGGILDVGVYPVSMARLVAGAASGMRFADPESVKGVVVLHPAAGVDCHASALMEFKGGIIASVSTGIDVTQENVVRIFGSKGSIYLPDPWLCKRTGRQDGRIVVTSGGGGREEIEVPFAHTSYALEADVCGEAIRAGLVQPAHPTAMTWDDTLGNMRTVDAWRNA